MTDNWGDNNPISHRPPNKTPNIIQRKSTFELLVTEFQKAPK